MCYMNLSIIMSKKHHCDVSKSDIYIPLEDKKKFLRSVIQVETGYLMKTGVNSLKT